MSLVLQGGLPDAPYEPTVWSLGSSHSPGSQGGFLLAVPLLQTSLPSPLNSRALDMLGEDGSDTCFSPRKVLAHEAETAGAVMAFFLSLGLALGAAVSFLVRILI